MRERPVHRRVRATFALALLVAVGALPIAAPQPVRAAAPSNDDRANAITLTGATGAVSGSTAEATTDVCKFQQYPPVLPKPRSVWYRWTAPSTGWIRWRTDGSSFPVDLLFTEDTPDLVCPSGGSPAPRRSVRQGDTYLVGIGSQSESIGGAFVASWTLRDAPKPMNDDFASGSEIDSRTGGIVAFNPHASKEPGEPNHAGEPGGRSIWFRWRAPVSGRAVFHTMGGETEGDTVLAVYTGDRVDSLTLVASDTDSGLANRSSRVVFTAAAGVTYHIAIDTVGGREGSIAWFDGCALCALRLQWNSGPGPANDRFIDARTLPAEGDRMWAQNLGASLEPGEPSHGDVDGQSHRVGASSWFRWTPPLSGPASVNVSARDFGAFVAVYRQTGTGGLAGLQTVAENDRVGLGANGWAYQAADWEAVGGETYYIAVDAGQERTGEYVITWGSGALDNDAFASPRVLQGVAGRIFDSNFKATKEDAAGEPDHAGIEGTASVWYTWTPSVGGSAQVDNIGPIAGTTLAVYTGDSLGSLVAVAPTEFHADWRKVAFTATAGTTYRIAVQSSLSGQTFELNWRVGPTEATPPTVALTSPADGAQIPGMIPLAATASDDSGIAWVDLMMVNGVVVCRDFAAPYACTGSTGVEGPDRYGEFLARATDVYGNVADSAVRRALGDTGPPEMLWQWKTVGEQPTGDARFELSNLEEPHLGWHCRLDQQPSTACTMPVTYQGLAVGGHWWGTQTTDIFGNSSGPMFELWEVAGPDTARPGGSVAVNGGAAATRNPSVSLRLHAWDFDSAITVVRVSNVATMSGGLLAKSSEHPYTTPLTWDLSDAATGGTAGDGIKTVYVQYRDAAGNWSAVQSDSIRLDRVAPTASTPTMGLLAGRPLGSNSVVARATWSGSDDASGVARYEVQRSTNGGTWTAVRLSRPAATSADVSIGFGSTHRVRVRAVDAAGNPGAWMTSSGTAPGRREETDGSVAYQGAWTRKALSGSSGGYVQSTSAIGASATLTFTGREVAWVARTGADRGTAKVYVGSALVTTIDLELNPLKKLVVFTRTWTSSAARTIRIIFDGPAGSGIDVDAFVVVP
jgi:hypothetical protein